MARKVNFYIGENDLQLLPHNYGLEKRVLAFIAKADVFPLALKYLDADGMFYHEWHIMIWELMKELHNKNVPITVNNLISPFETKGNRELVTYILTFNILDEWFVAQQDVKKFFLMLNEVWISRTICRLGYHLNVNGYKGNKEYDSLRLLGEASDGLDGIYRHIARMNDVDMDEASSELFKSIVQASNGLLGQPSTLSDINSIIKGYRKGNLIVLAASTHEGKTTLALQEAYGLVSRGVPVGYISLEMTTSELMLMIACTNLGFDIGDAMEGRMDIHKTTQLSNFIGRLKKMPINFSDKPALKIGELKAIVRTWKKQHDIKMVFVDHMHLAYDDIEHGSNTEQRFTNIANKLKELAKELDIPVMALAQLNRKEKGERTRQHAISDLKYASGIEQAADVIMMIYRPELYGINADANGNDTKGVAFILVPKLRLLRKRDFKCRFTGLKFLDWDMDRFYNESNPYAGMPKSNDKTPF